jgi:hypothetical protein
MLYTTILSCFIRRYFHALHHNILKLYTIIFYSLYHHLIMLYTTIFSRFLPPSCKVLYYHPAMLYTTIISCFTPQSFHAVYHNLFIFIPPSFHSLCHYLFVLYTSIVYCFIPRSCQDSRVRLILGYAACRESELQILFRYWQNFGTLTSYISFLKLSSSTGRKVPFEFCSLLLKIYCYWASKQPNWASQESK